MPSHLVPIRHLATNANNSFMTKNGERSELQVVVHDEELYYTYLVLATGYWYYVVVP